jgi:hypothetical protein
MVIVRLPPVLTTKFYMTRLRGKRKMIDYEAAFWKLKNNWDASVRLYEVRIEKLEAALREIVDRAEHRMGHAVSDDVCVIARKALEGKDG